MRLQGVLLVPLALTVLCLLRIALCNDIETDSPTDTLRTFYRAIADGDANVVRQASVRDKNDDEWIDSQIAVSLSCKHLGVAAMKQFGKSGAVLNAPMPAESVLKQIGRIKVEENGDTALWRYNPRVPLVLSKKDGHWKVDLLTSIPRKVERQETDLMAYIASYLDEIARGIENGDYADVAQVQAELRRRHLGPIKIGNDSRSQKDDRQKRE